MKTKTINPNISFVQLFNNFECESWDDKIISNNPNCIFHTAEIVKNNPPSDEYFDKLFDDALRKLGA